MHAKRYAYYSEFDPHAAQWLRNLIDAGAIAPGVVDERDIRDVRLDDLKGFRQCHFFAGVGGWSYALRQAGWEDSREVWTGSCPCQSFSAAGKRAGFADERHLWPAFFHLIGERRPPVVFGEQVASKDGLAWLDLVHADMEGAGYAFGAFDLCAAGVGAPHARQRLYFVAHSGGERHEHGDARRSVEGVFAPNGWRGQEAGAGRPSSDMANPKGIGLFGRQDDGDDGRRERASRQGSEAGGMGDTKCLGRESRNVAFNKPTSSAQSAGAVGRLGDADEPGLEGRGLPQGERPDQRAVGAAGASRSMDDGERPSPTNGYWRDADWLFCTDGKWRPAQPLPQQMVDGPAAGLGCVRTNQDTGFPLIEREAFGAGGAFESKSRAKMLRGYGNALVAPLALEFIKAAMECLP